MSRETLQSIEEMAAARDGEDNRALFEKLWQITGELRAKVDARFELHADSSTAELQPFEAPGGAGRGFLSAFAGPEVDWLVHSWIGRPETGFTNMHLTLYLGPQVRVPHFGFALGTAPDIFMYMDYQPRCDLMTDLDALDRYYEPVNESFLKLREDERFSPFISRCLYMRQTQSQTSHCYIVKPSEETLEIISRLGHEMMDRWLGWLDEAEPVPEAERAALAARDLQVRRQIVERDPANVMGVKLFGEERVKQLLRALWGGGRKLPRPGQSA